MKHTYIKPLAIALLLGVLPLTISSAQAVTGSTGPKGDKGAIGPKGDKGAIGPKGDKGAIGPKGDKGGAIGPKGDKGATGLPGAAGGKGDKGATGLPGAAGGKGDKGATGLPGTDGAAGLDGQNGVDGLPGTDGAAGLDGQNGVDGLPGTDGASAPVHAIGDPYQGGIVFWVDPDGQHGLIATKADQSPGVQWYNGTYFQTNATADGIYAGAKNTEIIIATQTSVGLVCGELTVPSYCSAGAETATGDYAALIAANYSVQDNGIDSCTGAVTETCYADWYLPSKEELNLLYNQKSVVGGFACCTNYASSTEYELDASHFAWIQHFLAGVQGRSGKEGTGNVRAVRAF